MPHEKGMTHDDWRHSKEDYLKCPSYTHPVYGTPLQEPYKPSDGTVVVAINGVPVKKEKSPTSSQQKGEEHG
jgi:hypothetical protein